MSKERKRCLLQEWLSAHALGRCAQLFKDDFRSYELSGAAESVLRTYEDIGSMTLYVVYLDDVQSGMIPVYIGKSEQPLRRWKHGHRRNLVKVLKERTTGLYAEWVKLFEREKSPPFILCVGDEDVLFPPIPKFPLTIGSIEYQLISLASDAFGSYLLNFEGRSR